MGKIVKALKGYVEALGGTYQPHGTSDTIKNALRQVAVQYNVTPDPKDSVPTLIQKMSDAIPHDEPGGGVQ